MLTYGESFLEANRKALEKLKEVMTPEAYEFAVRLAQEEIEEREQEALEGLDED